VTDEIFTRQHTHAPYIEHAIKDGGDELREFESEPFEYLRDGGKVDTVWNAYLTELHSALTSIERLLNNFDAEKVVITADHGEAFGEWNVYGHMSGSIHPYVRKVPWVRTSAADNRIHTPEQQGEQDVSEEKLKSQLEALGYI